MDKAKEENLGKFYLCEYKDEEHDEYYSVVLQVVKTEYKTIAYKVISVYTNAYNNPDEWVSPGDEVHWDFDKHNKWTTTEI